MIVPLRLALATALALLAASTAEARPCALPGIAPTALRGSRNAVAISLLCPRMLLDSKTLARYLAAFPRERYRIYKTRANNRFYLDDRKDIIKSTLRRGHPWEGRVRALLRKHARKGSTVVDAGAHIGTHAVDLGRLLGPKGRVYAFEPQRKIYRELVENLRLNKVASRVIPLRFALGSANKVIEMNRATPGNEGGTAVGHGGDKAEVRTLDSFALQNISVLKIDVEGHETQLLLGAKKTIRTQHPVILIEIQGGYDLDRAPLARQRKGWATIKLLNRLGYRVRRTEVHDFIALPRRKQARLPLSFERTHSARERHLMTQAGEKTEHGVRSTGRAGTLLYGPYAYLPPGAYIVRWKGTCSARSKVSFDVASKKGTVRHGSRSAVVEPSTTKSVLASVAFTLRREAKDVEYRIVVDANAKLLVSEIELLRLAR